MLIPRPQDAVHKAWLYRLITSIADDAPLIRSLRFKGGTCAAMLGYLNRFSVNLDFDLIKNDPTSVRHRLEKHFQKLGLRIDNSSSEGVQYLLKYPSESHQRNTLKLDTLSPVPQSNQYENKYLPEIDRTFPCQTRETMFANKLVAVLDRYNKNRSIAGRDIYDIDQFFLKGFRYRTEIIKERHRTSVIDFFKELIQFIEKHINNTILQQDLTPLLPYEKFRRIYKTLKQETLSLLNDELKRLSIKPYEIIR